MANKVWVPGLSVERIQCVHYEETSQRGTSRPLPFRLKRQFANRPCYGYSVSTQKRANEQATAMTSNGLVDVLIVGGGPTGTALAIDLARRGIGVRIIEKSPTAFGGSRAKGVQPRTLEVLEDLGVIDDIIAGGSLYPKLGIHLGPFTVPWSMFKNVQPRNDVPYPNTWLIPQLRVDAALHARLHRLGVAVEFGTELTGFEQHADSVTANIRSEGAEEQVRARYLVGADGGSSHVRGQLGVQFGGSTDEFDKILIVDGPVSGLARDRWHMWPRGGGQFVGACPLPHSDSFQWMIRLARGEAPPEGLPAVSARILKATGDRGIVLHRIHWQSVFRPNIRLAEAYRRGRVFLAGDAAHVHTPAGAQGLNTGIQDAYNIGWKLGQVLAGAPESLLDTYEQERRPIAAGVLGLSTRKYQAIGSLDPSAVRRGKDEQQLALSYREGPLAGDPADGTATLRAGDRAPDSKLVPADGGETRVFELLRGPHFTAIAFGTRAAQALACLQWPEAGAGLSRVYVGAQTSGSGIFCSDPGRHFQTTYGLNGDTLLLIRPDGYIAHIASKDILARTQERIAELAPSELATASVPLGQYTVSPAARLS
jgi:2-polyprenyl-6-methoxyphenol hydroxylase-like FAD-dependent oxidoreductase